LSSFAQKFHARIDDGILFFDNSYLSNNTDFSADENCFLRYLIKQAATSFYTLHGFDYNIVKRWKIEESDPTESNQIRFESSFTSNDIQFNVTNIDGGTDWMNEKGCYQKMLKKFDELNLAPFAVKVDKLYFVFAFVPFAGKI